VGVPLPAESGPVPRDQAARSGVPPRPHPVGRWPVVVARLGGGAVVLWGVLCLLGLLLTHVLDTGAFHHADLSVVTWLAAHRTPAWNDITHFASTMAQTDTAIVVTGAIALALRWRLGRWYESLVLIAAMLGELAVYESVQAIVHRPRPPVIRLDMATPDSSFPSGHTGAATALYVSLALLVLWVYGRRPAPRIVAGLLCCVPFFVAFSRMYRGMHYPTDVLGGAFNGGVWLTLVFTTLLPGRRAAGAVVTGAPAIADLTGPN
jgi:membrane-associated phospholipid phosphatase